MLIMYNIYIQKSYKNNNIYINNVIIDPQFKLLSGNMLHMILFDKLKTGNLYRYIYENDDHNNH